MPTQKVLYRIKGCGCDCSTMPADPCAPCNAGAYQLQLRSRSSVATLIGFSAYRDPVIPPKKWLTETLSGSVQASIHNSPDCSGAPVGGIHLASGGGARTYDSHTGVLTNNMLVSGSGFPSGPVDPTTIGSGDPLSGLLFASGWPFQGETTLATSVRTQARLARNSAPLCCGCIFGGGGTSENMSEQAGMKLLSFEDTEEMAMARVPATGAAGWSEWGAGSRCTNKSMRGAGEFTFAFQEAEYRIRVAGVPGTLVHVKLTFSRTSHGDYEIVYQDTAQRLTFPADKDEGWTTGNIPAGPGESSCLIKDELYTP